MWSFQPAVANQLGAGGEVGEAGEAAFGGEAMGDFEEALLALESVVAFDLAKLFFAFGTCGARVA